MRRRAKSSLLWGVIGGLLFVVLAQGYLIVGGSLSTGYIGMLTVGLVVGITVGLTSYIVEPRLAAKGRT